MPQPETIAIHIDKKLYKVTKTTMTGSELRALPQPPIGSERDLWQVVPGKGDDHKIGDTEQVALKDGMHFYSAPATINPGGPR